MTGNNRFLTKLLLAGQFLICAAVASASTSFDFTSQSLNPGSANSGGSLSMTSDGLTVTETAWWANVNNSGSTVTGTSNKFVRSWLGAYSDYGVGVCDPNEQSGCSSPQHQVDNYSGMDFLLLSFSSAVSLNQLGVQSYGNPTGSGYSDVDMSYAILTEGQEASLVAGNLVFSSITFVTSNTARLSSNDYSLSGTGQYVLLGSAVTRYFGDTSSSSATADAFKLQDITVTGSAATPEPASFVLMGSVLLIGAMVFRRRQKQRAL